MPGPCGDHQELPVAERSAEPRRPPWLSRITIAFVVLTVAFLAIYALVPTVGVRQGVYFGSHVVSVAAFTVGVFTSRRGFRRDWLLVLVGMYVWVLVDLTGLFTLDAEGFPTSWAPGVTLSLVAYCFVTVGVFRLGGRDGFVRGSAVGLDGGVFLISALLVWWLLIGQDFVSRPGSLTAEMVVAGIGPVGDAMLLAAASALTSSRAAHTLSARALTVSALTGLVSDLTFSRFAFGYPVAYPSMVAALWMIQYASAALAALASGRPAGKERSRMTVSAIVFVVAALVLPPLLAVYAAVVPQDGLRVDTVSLIVLVLGTLLMTVLVSVRASMLLRRIQRQADDLERTARTDDLTRLPNRRAGDRILREAVDLAHDSPGETLCIALLDLDHFKRFNDTHGHQHGDRLLRVAARTWTAVLASRGTLFRYGGEEFVVVLPATSATEAHALLAQLQRATPFDQTFSAGLATLRPGEDAEALLGRADASLYAAKVAGRARTVEAA